MNNYNQVMKILQDLKDQGKDNQEIVWKLALACLGWPYIFGDRGAYCTPAHRQAAYKKYGTKQRTIKTACRNFDGDDTCLNCKWRPDGGKTLAFDCRGFTYWCILKVYGWKLMGSGATKQWNTESNWKEKGTIGNVPQNKLVCLFVRKGNKMEHTGFGLGDETIECSSGVQHFTKRNAKWTHWGIPLC